MGKNRRTIPKSIEKRAFQQAGARCSFCEETEVVTLQIHHIDGNPENNVLENLLVVCASCHQRVTNGLISESEVRARKRELSVEHRQAIRNGQSPIVRVAITNSEFRGDIAQNITKFVSRGVPRIIHPVGSLGADLCKKGYIDYLISRYYQLRKAEASYGIRRSFSHAEIHQTIQREFVHKTFFMPVEFFDRLVLFLYGRIDRTVLGRNNRARRVPNYHSYEEHIAEQKQKKATPE